MKRLAWRLVVASVLLATGLSSLGRGAWIYAKAQLAQVLLARAWHRTEGVGVGFEPWPWADSWPVARLLAPAEGVELIVLAGGSGSTLAFAPGHLDFSADPGRPGNCVIAGHRDTHFAFLEELSVGAELVVVRPDGGRLGYVVREVGVVDRDQTWVMEASGGCELTLVTCFPFRDPVPGGPLRYVVRATADPAECGSDHIESPTPANGLADQPGEVAKFIKSFKIGAREGNLAHLKSTLHAGCPSLGGGCQSA